ncbi:MAG: hypothetical protein RL095_1789 [Verrucomicrobiota bacterium]|jgi:small-conductance mechanosensitive channel
MSALLALSLDFDQRIFFNSALFPWLCGLSIFLVSLLADRIILARLKIWADKTEWKFDDVLIASIKGILPFWGLCWGIHCALHLSGMNGAYLLFGTVILLVLSVTAALSRFAIGLVNLYTESFSHGSSSIIPLIVRIGIWTMGVLVALQSIGIQIAPILTALGVGGLAVALALQPTLANLFSGVQIIIAKQIRIGDYLRLEGGQEGFVVDIAWRNTTLRQPSNNIIVIPNSKLCDSVVINHHLPEPSLNLVVNLAIPYDTDLAKTETILLDEARSFASSHPGCVVNEDLPCIRYGEFGDSGVSCSIVLRVTAIENQGIVKHQLIKALHARLGREKIAIPYPTRTVYHIDAD